MSDEKRKTNNFKGVYTALITPFYKGEVDFESLESLVKLQIKRGIDGFIVNGTTAESPSLKHGEVREIYQCIKGVSENSNCIVGVGSNCTRSTIENINRVNDWRPEGLLVVVPYYNKPNQKGMIAHFRAAAESSELPIMLYNVPGRTVVSLSVDSTVELSHIDNIYAIKDATGDIPILEQTKKLTSNFSSLSGDDATFAEFCINGGDGIVSVCSHLLSKEMKSYFLNPNELAKKEFNERYLAFIKNLYIDANPIPLKHLLWKLDVIRSPELRLPLVSLDEAQSPNLLKSWNELGISL